MPTPTTTRAATVERPGRLTRRDVRPLIVMAVIVLGLHAIGFGLLIAVSRGHYVLGSGSVFGIGLGVTAYTLGMRHAFDADHIAAIDNTTRKLIADGRRSLTTGMWFSLGHSTVVFLLCLLLTLGIKTLVSQVGNDGSVLQTTAGLVGTIVSGTFLLIIGILNLNVLIGIIRTSRRIRDGSEEPSALDQHLAKRGALIRVIGRVLRLVERPWQMYPVGFLFGLGFDTATEISLLMLAGGAAAISLPWYGILTLPILFAAGMSLLDGLDGIGMRLAYGWAHDQPVRRIYYNVVITGVSIAVCLIIGLAELDGLAAGRFGIHHGPIAWIADIDLDNVGFYLVALLLGSWLIALLVWKFGHIEDRWSRRS